VSWRLALLPFSVSTTCHGACVENGMLVTGVDSRHRDPGADIASGARQSLQRMAATLILQCRSTASLATLRNQGRRTPLSSCRRERNHHRSTIPRLQMSTAFTCAAELSVPPIAIGGRDGQRLRGRPSAPARESGGQWRTQKSGGDIVRGEQAGRRRGFKVTALAAAGGYCVFSPVCASFDCFRI
jgi:hypothetical protein